MIDLGWTTQIKTRQKSNFSARDTMRGFDLSPVKEMRAHQVILTNFINEWTCSDEWAALKNLL